MTFLFSFYAKQRRLKSKGKDGEEQSYLTTSREDMREAHTILAS